MSTWLRIYVSAHSGSYASIYMRGRLLTSICARIVIAAVFARAVVLAIMQYYASRLKKSVRQPILFYRLIRR